MKLVVDTNVLLSGTLWTGTASRLVDALLDGPATLCLSASVLAEFAEVIQRDKFRPRLEQQGRSVEAILSRFEAVAVVVKPGAIQHPRRCAIRMTSMSSPVPWQPARMRSFRETGICWCSIRSRASPFSKCGRRSKSWG